MNTNKRESKSGETSSIGVDSRPFADKGVEALAGRDHKIWPACLSPSDGYLFLTTKIQRHQVLLTCGDL